ncbi:MAG: hypothetical protein IPP51_17490 [Bacteroidetes bacterium]|nr:hypothetical protein [Bacteroidota bacterium]
MNDTATPVETLFEKAEDLSKTTIQLLRLRTISKSAELFSSLAVQLAISIVVAFLFFLLSIGISLWLGEMMGKIYYGFFTITGFYMICALVVYQYRSDWIQTPISDAIITQMQKEDSK